MPDSPRFVPVSRPTPSSALPRVQPIIYQEKAPNAQGEKAIYPKDSPRSTQSGSREKTNDDQIDFYVRTELPDPGRLFGRESERQFFERIRQDAKSRLGSGPVLFPQQTVISKEPYQGRTFPQVVSRVEPAYVAHRKLLFEQPNFERGGWDFGPVQPALNLGIFYYDVALLPYHYWTRPHDHLETSAGKCLPGDPSPLLLYCEPWSWTGAAAQAGTVVGGVFLFR
jgi:hypothetical protein